MKTILLTGATGFLGSHLLKYFLSKRGNYNFIVLKRSFSNTERIKDVFNSNSVKFYDIDKIDLNAVFEKNKPEIIIHCATKYGRRTEQDNSVYAVLETNLMFPIKLLELSIKYNTQIFINTDSYFNKDNLRYSNLLNYSLSKKSIFKLTQILKMKRVSLFEYYRIRIAFLITFGKRKRKYKAKLKNLKAIRREQI